MTKSTNRRADTSLGLVLLKGRTFIALALLVVYFSFRAPNFTEFSSIILLIKHASLYGLLAIGSQDPERFTPDKGNLFLRYLAQVLNQCLRRLALPGA